MSEQQDSPAKAKLVVGLGNPGQRYARTRHNVGFRVADALAQTWGLPGWRGAFGGHAQDARPTRGGVERRVVLLKPHTFMNCSGQAVKGLAAFYKSDPSELLIVLDDMALPLGRLRMRASGSAGGHNGLADVLRHLGTDEVPRLRVGVGAPALETDAADFVLSPFEADESSIVERAVAQAARAVEDWVFNGAAYVMDRYNRKPDDQEVETCRSNNNGSQR